MAFVIVCHTLLIGSWIHLELLSSFDTSIMAALHQPRTVLRRACASQDTKSALATVILHILLAGHMHDDILGSCHGQSCQPFAIS